MSIINKDTMDTQELKARSIELAERAYRQKSRATESSGQTKLDEAADELIQIDNSRRFYLAQSKLESDKVWTEEERALGHEMNVADQSIQNIKPLAIDDVIKILEQWVAVYEKSNQLEVLQLGLDLIKSISSLKLRVSLNVQKEALNHLLSLFEIMLSYIQSQITDNSVNNSTVVLLRNMRDAALTARELAIDDNELIKLDAQESDQTTQRELAHKSLDEIYKTIPPIMAQ